MEPTGRRSSTSRLFAFFAMVFLTVVAISTVSTPGVGATHQALHRRNAPPYLARQEASPEPSDIASLSESLSESSTSSSSSIRTTSRSSSSTSTSRSSSTSSSRISTSSSTTPTSTSTSTSTTPTTSSTATSPLLVVSSSVPISSPSSTGTPPLAPIIGKTIATHEFTITDDVFTESPALPTPPSNEGPQETSRVDAVGGASKGFWANKGAVAATFVIISIVILGIGGFLVTNILKKRNKARQARLRQELFGEKFAGSDGGPYSPNGSSHGHGAQLSASSHREVVYDDSRFTGAVVTSEYPFAATSAAAVSSRRSPETFSPSQPTQTTPQPPNSSHSHTSQQTAYWTPNQSQQSVTTQQHGHGAEGYGQATQYMLPSQAQAQYTQPLVDANTPGNPFYYGETGYYNAGNYTNQYATYGATQNPFEDHSMALSTTPVATSNRAPPVAFKNPKVQRDSIDSFYGNYGKQSPAPAGVRVT